jgi:membrane associated rhomboid family serine protease
MIPLHDDNPTRTIPVITMLVIVACSFIFFWQLSLGPGVQRAIYGLGLIPVVFLNFEQLPIELVMVPSWSTLFTSMFLHGGWMHLIGNMLYLWIFGNNIEDIMGHGRFIIFYLLCGAAAALGQALPNPQSTIPMIGASGAISGVLGAYLLLFPHARILVAIPLGFIIHTTRLAAGWVLAFWFVLQVINSYFSGQQEGGVAWGAHIGGFIAGMLLIPLFKYKNVKFFAPRRSGY